jgi:hypothetical protein
LDVVRGFGRRFSGDEKVRVGWYKMIDAAPQ